MTELALVLLIQILNFYVNELYQILFLRYSFCVDPIPIAIIRVAL